MSGRARQSEDRTSGGPPAAAGGPQTDDKGRRLADLVLRNAGELVTMMRPAREGLGVLAGGALAAYEGKIVWNDSSTP